MRPETGLIRQTALRQNLPVDRVQAKPIDPTGQKLLFCEFNSVPPQLVKGHLYRTARHLWVRELPGKLVRAALHQLHECTE